MKNNQLYIGIAVLGLIAILAFWNHASDTTAPQTAEQKAKGTFRLTHAQNSQAKLSALQYAYTGKWEKNVVTNSNVPPQPAVVVAAAKPVVQNKKAAQKPVKKVAKKQPTKYRYYTGQPTPAYYPTVQKQRPVVYNNANYQVAPSTANHSTPNTDTKKSAQDYLKAILESKNINQLVSDYKANRTDAATFYSVIGSLLAPSQSDASVRLLAYQALGKVGPSSQSFIILASHKDLETSSNAKQAAENDLNAYINISDISLLNTMLSNNNDSIRITAAQIIQALVTQTLGLGSTNNHGGTVAIQQYAQLFNSVLQNLNQLIQRGNLDSQVSMVFSSTRNTIQQFLG